MVEYAMDAHGHLIVNWRDGDGAMRSSAAPKVGEQLPSAYTVQHVRPRETNNADGTRFIVMAETRYNGGPETKWATWEWTPWSGTYWGHYFRTEPDAMEDYLGRDR